MRPVKNVRAFIDNLTKKDIKKANDLEKIKVYCECGHSIPFRATNKYNNDRLICHYCGKYVYRNEEIKKKYELEDFERKLKKYMKVSNENVDRTKGRNVGVQRNTKNRKKTR